MIFERAWFLKATHRAMLSGNMRRDARRSCCFQQRNLSAAYARSSFRAARLLTRARRISPRCSKRWRLGECRAIRPVVAAPPHIFAQNAFTPASFRLTLIAPLLMLYAVSAWLLLAQRFSLYFRYAGSDTREAFHYYDDDSARSAHCRRARMEESFAFAARAPFTVNAVPFISYAHASSALASRDYRFLSLREVRRAITAERRSAHMLLHDIDARWMIFLFITRTRCFR